MKQWGKWGLIIMGLSLNVGALLVLIQMDKHKNEHWAIREGNKLVGQAQKMLDQDREVLKKVEEIKQRADETLKRAEEETKRLNEIKNLYDYIKRHTTARNYNELQGFTILVYDWCKEENVDVYHVIPYFEIENEFELRRKGDGGRAAGPGQLWKPTWDLFAGRFGFSDKDYKRWQCNSRVSVAFAADLYRKYGNWNDAIGFYNGGTEYLSKESVKGHLARYWAAYNRLQKFIKTQEVEKI